MIQEEVKKTAETPKFDPVQHRKNLLSNTKSNRQIGELYVRVSGIDSYPKATLKAEWKQLVEASYEHMLKVRMCPFPLSIWKI